MECENTFCVYEKRGQCILDTISLDAQGSCWNYIYVNIDDDILQKEKDRILRK